MSVRNTEIVPVEQWMVEMEQSNLSLAHLNKEGMLTTEKEEKSKRRRWLRKTLDGKNNILEDFFEASLGATSLIILITHATFLKENSNN